MSVVGEGSISGSMYDPGSFRNTKAGNPGSGLMAAVGGSQVAPGARPVLRVGTMSNSAEIRILQEALNKYRAGRKEGPISVDGIFTRATFGAVAAFQRGNALPADGIVGGATWEALERTVGPLPKVDPAAPPPPPPALPPGMPPPPPSVAALIQRPAPAPTPQPAGVIQATILASETPLTGEATEKSLAARNLLAGLKGAVVPAPAAPRPEEVFAATARGFTSEECARAERVWSAVPGKTSATLLQANGLRPVVVHLPADFSADKPAASIIFFHGQSWNVGDKMREFGVLDRVKTLGSRDPQQVFIFPQAAAAPFDYWMAPSESFRQLMKQALGEAARLAGSPIRVNERVVDAHTGGGLALKNAVLANELSADKVNLLDAAYEDWAQTVVQWARDRRPGTQPRIESFYTNHSSLPANNQQIAIMAPGIVKTLNVRDTQKDLPKYRLGSR